MNKHVKLNENYFLVTQEVNSEATIEVTKKVNHIIVTDVSGSMSNDLPEIRKNLKNKISNLVKSEEDTISIVCFSGKNDAIILKEDVHVNSLKQLNDLNEAIDKFLKPIGLTAFAKPLELTNEIIDRISKSNPDSLFSLIFMSDGYSNDDTSWSAVMNAVKQLSAKLSSTVIVEYGWNADSARLTEIATALGGEKIFSADLSEYDVIIDNSLNKKHAGGKKIVVEIGDDYLYDFAFTVSNDSILLYNIVDGKITVNSDIGNVNFFSKKAIGAISNNVNSDTVTSLYAAIYTLSDRLLSEDAEKIFYALGDQYHYQMLSNAYGKQKLNEFKSAIKECVVDTTKRFPLGIANISPVDDNAYCLMNLIADLGNVNNCQFFPNHESFQYNRIGRKRVAVGSNLTDADKQRLSEAKNVEEAAAILKEFEEKKLDIKFININPNRGYSVSDLVWNENRANLSLRIRIDGEVNLPSNKFNIDKVSSFKYNTFTLIKDGILNIDKLPVGYDLDLEKHLIANSVKYELEYNKTTSVPYYIIIDLTSLPIINRGMVRNISAVELGKLEFELTKIQATKKVYDYYKKSLFPTESKTYVDMLGQDCADWLKEIGITDFNGFQPKSTAGESTDHYMSVNLITKIKGLSTFPKVIDVVAKIQSNKPLKLNEMVMADAIKKYLEQLESDMYLSLDDVQQKEVLKKYLETKSSALNKQRRDILQQIAQIKFSLILSRKNFVEFKSFDDNKLTLVIDNQSIDFTFEFTEEQVMI